MIRHRVRVVGHWCMPSAERKGPEERKEGGGRKRIPGGVQARLVAEASRLFAARGFDGVAVDEIVAAAGVNKRMVYHYFGNKEGIYRAAVNHVFADLQVLEKRMIDSHSEKDGPVKGLRKVVSLYFSFHGTYPEFVRILQWENLNEGRHLAVEESGMNKNPILEHLEKLLKEGAAAGVFRKGLDARLVLTSLIGLTGIYFSNRHTLSRSLGLDFGREDVLARAAAHAEKVLLAGLRADPPA
ncbi:TetR/AcrR family transcriptional regulator [Luteolibacter sp. SL250]|uniref:TetR/AcrR family transcriptional regulator n=1 Tax=Luteolibacter sp. SL250 TaxID=2995170 RepID=UPI0022701123|nr:TetR/AcrR family transcriptional regulator [Luteolibacter sp. SL250]WAC19100.1 TetR/AcrR family transcriptional regulator [Luteolibacter sp. SL250]